MTNTGFIGIVAMMIELFSANEKKPDSDHNLSPNPMHLLGFLTHRESGTKSSVQFLRAKQMPNDLPLKFRLSSSDAPKNQPQPYSKNETRRKKYTSQPLENSDSISTSQFSYPKQFYSKFLPTSEKITSSALNLLPIAAKSDSQSSEAQATEIPQSPRPEEFFSNKPEKRNEDSQPRSEEIIVPSAEKRNETSLVLENKTDSSPIVPHDTTSVHPVLEISSDRNIS